MNPSRPFPFADANAEKLAATFPGAARLEPFFTRRLSPSSLSGEASRVANGALFSEFEPHFARVAADLTSTSTVRVAFERFGFATPSDFQNVGSASESILFVADSFAEQSDARSVGALRFLFVAPISTFQLVLDAALGFDVARLCADPVLWADFEAESQKYPTATPLEREIATPELVRFATLCPTTVFDSNENRRCEFRSGVDSNDGGSVWRAQYFLPTRPQTFFDLNDDLLYWERRSFELSGRRFPWTLFFPASRLAAMFWNAPNGASKKNEFVQDPPERAFSKNTPIFSNASNRAERSEEFFVRHSDDFSNDDSDDFQRDSRDDSPNDETSEETKKISNDNRSENSNDDSVELSVEIARGTLRADVWRRLQPGDVLSTETSADALFLALLNGRPRFFCKPGLFRGAPAIQIKSDFEQSNGELDEQSAPRKTAESGIPEKSE